MFEAVGKSAAFPKMFNTRKFPGAILRLGTVGYANTAGREAVIKPLRTCWEQTNKQPRTLGQQVAQHVQLSETLGAASRQQAGAKPPHQAVGMVSSERGSCSGVHALPSTTVCQVFACTVAAVHPHVVGVMFILSSKGTLPQPLLHTGY